MKRFFVLVIVLLSSLVSSSLLAQPAAPGTPPTKAAAPKAAPGTTPAKPATPTAPATAPQPVAPLPTEEGTTTAEEENVGQPSILTEISVLAGLSVLPFAIMLLTSYMKIVIVLSLLRNALGVQQSPPNQVLNGIALLMSIYVMFPTGLAMYKAAEESLLKNPPGTMFSSEGAGYIIDVVEHSKEPLRDFLQRNAAGGHISGFYQLAQRSFPEPFRAALKPTDFIVVIPAFITSQLKSAFEIGVLVYLPFFVIDLVTSNILLAMGMMMLSPLTIALPLKLLLLVMVDGWTLIIQGLVLTFR
jgi:type III secretion protein R